MSVPGVARTGRFLLGLLLSLPGATLAQPSDAKPTATLLLASDVACTVRLDGEKVADLAPDEPRRIAVEPGEHLLFAATPDGQKWRKVVEAKTATQTVVLIEFPAASPAGPAAPSPPAAVGKGTSAADVAARTARRESPKGLKEEIEASFANIPSGSFEMGCSEGDKECDKDEKPSHTVRITTPFQMMKTEVTVAWFREWAGPAGYEVPGQPDWSADDVPVVNVTWNDAQAFCAAFGARLPTEAEWEYAARASSTAARYGPLDEIAWTDGNSGGRGHPVAGRKPNAFGLYDTLGNAWEWCADLYGERYYREKVEQDPVGPASGTLRVLRGGSWNSIPSWVRVSSRDRVRPSKRSDGIGFRCVRAGHPDGS